MIRFQVLGGFELSGSDGRVFHSLLAQPKRQAVLVFLAVAVPRGYHRRDSLIALLWPESDDERARGSLSKAVSHLRQSLGADSVLSRGHAELGLDWRLVWCDAAGFEDALDRGALAEAMALYRGDLLPGFHVDETPEFSQWLEGERTRLRGRAIQASRVLSEQEESAGRLSTSIEWARRGATLDPFDELSVRRVMALLDKATDRSAALHAYEEFRTFLRDELDAEPASETAALAEAIRDRTTATSAAPLRVIGTGQERASPPLADEPTASPSPAASERVVVSAPAASWSRTPVILSIALAIVLVVAFLLKGRATGSRVRRELVAVEPFTVSGATTDKKLGERVARIVADRVGRDGPLSATEGARGNARFRLVGQVVARGDSIDVTAAITDSLAGRDAVAKAEATGLATAVDSLSDDIAWQITMMQPASTIPRTTSELTKSLAALRGFDDGTIALRAGRFADAARLYKSAVDADTTFALAYVNLSRAANWAGDYPMAAFASRRALQYIDRLSPLDQVRVRAWSAYEASRPVVAERLTRLVLTNGAGYVDAWYELGEVRFHWGPQFGWTRAQARAAFDQTLALSNEAGTIVHLARIAAADGQSSRVDSLVRRGLAMKLDEPQAIELRVLRAIVLGDRADTDHLIAIIARLDDDAAFSIISFAAAATSEYALARLLPQTLLVPKRAPKFRAIGLILSAELAMAHGRTGDALSALAAGPSLVPARSIEYRAALAALPFRATPVEELKARRDEILAQHDEGLIGPNSDQYAVNSIYPPRRAYLLAMLSLKLNDTAAAESYARELERNAGRLAVAAEDRRTVRLIRAELLRSRGQSAAALEMLGPAAQLPDSVLPYVMHYPIAHERFLRAELAAATGKPQEALRWHGTFPDPAAYDLMYRAPVLFGEAVAYDKIGQADLARLTYRRVVALLSDADSEWGSFVVRAKERLAAIR